MCWCAHEEANPQARARRRADPPAVERVGPGRRRHDEELRRQLRGGLYGRVREPVHALHVLAPLIDRSAGTTAGTRRTVHDLLVATTMRKSIPFLLTADVSTAAADRNPSPA